MEHIPIIVLVLGLLLWVVRAIIVTQRWSKEAAKSLPPGPKSWPVVGNFFQLGWAPHESLAELAAKHGPIMTLRLGSMSTVVVSSSQAARHMFKNHDAVLAGRKIYEAMKGDFGHEGSLITSQYGPHWRMLRRLCTAEFFAASRVDATRGVRASCVDRTVEFIANSRASSGSKGVDVGRFFFLMAFNLIGNLMFSRDLLGPKSEKGAEFFYHAGRVMELAGKPNVADFLPILRWLDPQGIRKRSKFHIERAFGIAGGFIEERMGSLEKDAGDGKRRDFLDVLLEYRGYGVEGPLGFSSRTINVIVFEMFIAGTDTTSSTLEWAMAELLRNPKTLQKVQSELRSIVGPNKKVQEEDMENLPYLKAVIKETLRLHPPLPFLVPHMAMDSCNMLGYHIPKETQILVNVWAIGRDPKTWEDPLTFRPERFLEPNTVDYKGHHFEFIPFGSGRRMCPAVPLASRVLPMALGSVLNSFDWVLPGGIEPEDVDMSERMGITLRKAVALKAIPIPPIS